MRGERPFSRRYLDVVNTARGLSPVNRRRALTTLAVGVFAPNVLAACCRRIDQAGREGQAAGRQPTLTFRPADSDQQRGADRADQRRGPRRLVPARRADQLRTARSSRARFNRDRTSTPITEPLGYDATYTWSGSAVGHDGKAVPVKGKFTTVAPDQGDRRRIPARRRPDRRGRGADHHPVRRADQRQGRRRAGADGHHRTRPSRAVGRGCPTRSAAPGCTGAPASTTRPAPRSTSRPSSTGWPSATAPTAKQDMRAEHRRSAAARWSRPRSRRTASRWSRDEGVIMDFPCSYGEADKARNVTRNGIHVVSEKYADFYMSNPAAGYSNVHERWAVRISNNGEFIHANPASAGAQGNTNVTNGCINLSTADAAAVLRQRDLRRPGRGHRQHRSSCPTPTATSGTGRSTGTPGCRCRRCRRRAAPSRRRCRSRAPRRPRRATRRRCRAPRRRRLGPSSRPGG